MPKLQDVLRQKEEENKAAAAVGPILSPQIAREDSLNTGITKKEHVLQSNREDLKSLRSVVDSDFLSHQ